MFPTATEPKTSGRRSGDPSSWPAERPTDRLLGPATIRTSITRLTLANECPTPTDGVGAMAELTPQCLASSVSDSCQISTANADQRWPDADARMAALWRLTIPDPVRPPFDRICKLGSPVRARHAPSSKPLLTRGFVVSEGNAPRAVAAKWPQPHAQPPTGGRPRTARRARVRLTGASSASGERPTIADVRSPPTDLALLRAIYELHQDD